MDSEKNEMHRICDAANDTNYNATYHKQRLKETLMGGIPGGLVGLALGIYLCCILSAELKLSWDLVLGWTMLVSMFTIVLAGFPLGWRTLNKILGQWEIFASIYLIVILFALKLGLSFVIGACLFPIKVIYHFIQSLKSKKKIRRAWIILIAIVVAFNLIGIIGTLMENKADQDDQPTYTTQPEVTAAAPEPPEYIDLFENVELSFEGISGDADAFLTCNREWDILNASEFGIYPDHDLKNGDVVTVTIENAASLLENYNIVPRQTQKEFVVSGLDRYATAADLPMDVVWAIAERFAAEKQEDLDGRKNEWWTYSDVVIAGIYFLEEKNSGATWCVNELHILITYSYFDVEENVCVGTYCEPLAFEGVIIDTEGNVNLAYEDGERHIFPFESVEECLNSISDEYTITKVW